MQPVLINYKITHIDILKVILTMLIPEHINTVGGSCYSAHQAALGFTKYHIHMVSSVLRKCQTRASLILTH